MKNTLLIIRTSFIAGLWLLSVLGLNCAPPKEGPQERVVPSKQITTYILTKLAKDKTYKIASNNLAGVVSSGNGETVYVVGKGNASLMGLDVANNKWADALGDWTAIQKASDHTPVNKSAHAVWGFEAFDKGIMFTIRNDNGLVILRGVGVLNSSHYAQPGNNYPVGGFTPYFVTDKDNNNYVYLLSGRDTPPFKRGIIFRPYVELPKKDNDAVRLWNNSLVKKLPKVHLDTQLYARVQDHEKNLLLADKDGIKRIKEADLGEDGKALDNNGAPIFGIDEFKLDKKTVNDHINTMELVDNKFLVVGLKSSAPNNGGIAVADLTQKKITWQHFGQGLGLSVDFISPERFKDKDKTRISAIIATDKGLLFMDGDGKMIEIEKGKGILITTKIIGDVRAETKDYDNAHDGFTGDRIPKPAKRGYLGGGQDKNGLWYLGFVGKADDDGGVFTLDPRIEMVEMPQPPPLLP